MPHSRLFLRRFCLRSKVARVLILAVGSLSFSAYGTEWRDCEKAKLRALQLQQNTAEHKTSKSKKRHRTGGQHQSVDEIDTWLWKNCREYSYELRQLEQEKM